jgi:hypothetical protein
LKQWREVIHPTVASRATADGTAQVSGNSEGVFHILNQTKFVASNKTYDIFYANVIDLTYYRIHTVAKDF